MDLVALLVLGALAATGLVMPSAALAGFSNAAVLTVWAMFILSEGLTRTGIARILGEQVLGIAGRGEIRLIIVIMITSGALSAFMNNIGVAALMLPVAIDVARRTGISPSRLLMPLAYGTLLGGLTTLIGTPPNLLISAAMRQNGLEEFGMFSFTPVGLGAMIAGIAFVAVIGRVMLPSSEPAGETQQRSQRNLRNLYGLQESTFTMTVPAGSVLVGKTLATSRIGSTTGLICIGLDRRGRIETLPSRNTSLAAGDRLIVQGRLDRFEELRRWSELVIEREAPVLQALVSEQVQLVETTVASDSTLVKSLLHHAEFRRHYGANLLAIRRGELVRRVNLAYVPLRAGDRLLLQCTAEALENLERSREFTDTQPVDEQELTKVYRLQERLFVVRVPKDSRLGGTTLGQSRLGDAFDFRLLGSFREGALRILPEPDEVILGGDILLIQGRPEDLDVLRGLQELEIEEKLVQHLNIFQSDRLAMLEATLSPQSDLAGKAVGELKFREKEGLELVAVLRSGQPIRSDLDRLVLQFGDALLLVGPRQKLALLEENADLLVLTPVGQSAPDTRRAPLAGMIMIGVVACVIAGFLPIAIAAIIGSSLMVLTGCLTMEHAYRAIDWRAVFLIAGMLPLGVAMQDTGAAEYIAQGVMGVLGQFGPWPVIMGLYAITAFATMIIPTAALVVLMSPIVLSACAELGIDPATAMMAVAMAASASFTSPISHPANILVMGPGGYRFVDYIKIGVPLTLVIFVVVMILLPIFWPVTSVTATAAGIGP
jgi:di/tricarboxylate transporter